MEKLKRTKQVVEEELNTTLKELGSTEENLKAGLAYSGTGAPVLPERLPCLLDLAFTLFASCPLFTARGVSFTLNVYLVY